MKTRNNYNFVFIILILFIVTSCTYSINMVHTAGSASDVIDEVQSNEPDVKTNIKVPIKPF